MRLTEEEEVISRQFLEKILTPEYSAPSEFSVQTLKTSAQINFENRDTKDTVYKAHALTRFCDSGGLIEHDPSQVYGRNQMF